MTPEKPKASNAKNPPAPAKPGPAKPAVAEVTPLVKPPPMFRRADWLSFGITTLVMFLSYMYTLAPDLTLEDSGELATASFYAGVPHPPGYPVWTVYSWLFTVLLPFSNIAWRVGVSSAIAAALSCGLVAMMVSRGSSMIMEGISELKDIAKTWENEICVVTGFVSGALIGFDGFMWSQAVIVEVYGLTSLSLAGVLILLFRWLYAPHQHRYLYLAWFTFGIAFNNHQSVMVCALAMVVLMGAVQARMGRDTLLGGAALFVLALAFNHLGQLTTLNDQTPGGISPVMMVFCLIGIGTITGWISLCVKTKSVGAAAPYILGYVGLAVVIAMMSPTPGQDPATVKAAANATTAILILGVVAVMAAVVAGIVKKDNGFNWAILCASAFMVGALFYLYMALTSMTNPPLNWGYPRTVTGFIHAFTRGQYERVHPTTGTGTGFEWLWSFGARYVMQLKMLMEGTLEEINPFFLLIIPLSMFAFLRLRKSEDSEAPWLRTGRLASLVLVGLSSLYAGLRAAGLEQALHDSSQAGGFSAGLMTFFMTLIGVGGVAASAWVLLCVLRCLQPRERAWVIGLFALWVVMGPFLIMLFNPSPDRQTLSLIKVFFTPSHMFVAMGVGYGLTLLLATLATAYERMRRHAAIITVVLAGLAACGVYTTFQQTDYYMPQAAAVLGAVVVAGVAAMLALPRMRAPIGALLAVFALMPGHSVLGHWSDNEQRGHWFGHWFGHDMFTPPFTAPDGKLSYDPKLRAQLMKDPEKAKLIYPEMDKHTVLYGGTDPGRFCPTYTIFCDSFIPPECRTDTNYDRRDVYIITQNALADGTYLNYIRAQFNRSAQIDPPFFSELVRSERERSLNYKTNLLARMVLPLDNLFLTHGDNVEKDRRAGSSFFKETDFTDLAGLARKLKDGAAPASVSAFLRANLDPATVQLLSGPADKALARALARDLSRLMDSEYESNRDLPAWQAELAGLTNELASLKIDGKADTRAFRSKQAQADELQKRISAALKIVPFYSSPLFLTGEINDLPTFVGRLQSDTNMPLSQFIWSQFTLLERQYLADPSLALREKQLVLATALNRLIEGPALLDPQRFAGVNVTDDLRRAFDAKPTGMDLIRLNRRLLEGAYPQALIRPAWTQTDRFGDLRPSEYVTRFSVENPQLHSRIRLFRLLLEEAYPKEIAKSLGGVYPDTEIYTASNEDSQRCFGEYMQDAQERMKKGQLRPGEDVRVVDNKVQVSGQVAVMAINGLLTKVIFDHNPDHEFYVEESFPLDWMYPHLTPFGIIMKINRQPVPEMTEEIIRRDHEFWSQYSQRLIGSNVVTYTTSISNLCAFAERTYVKHDYRGFQGDPRFVRDDDGQKAFSKLRSSIAGVYAWRIDNAKSEPERQRCLKEAEFAFKQAFAFCPYSPEALYRYVNILIRNGRIDDARMMAATSKKLDPDNAGLDNLLKELERIKGQQHAMTQSQGQLPGMEAEFRAHPGNVTNALQLAQTLAQMGQTDRVKQIADSLMTNAPNDANAVYFAVQIYSQLRDTPKLETALERWAQVSPTPEAWLDLAAMKTMLNKQPQAVAALKMCLDLNARRLAANPKSSNIALLAKTDDRLKTLQGLPEVQQMLATNK